MRMLRVLRQRARSLFRGAHVDAELDRELAFHLEQLTRENLAAGMPPEKARQAARRALGGVAQLEEECRDHRRLNWLTGFARDIAYAWRMLRKAPGFTALAVGALGLGVGAAIAVYTLAEAVMLGMLPFPAPHQLVAIGNVHARRGMFENVGQANFRDWQAANTVFSSMAFTEYSQFTLTGLGESERITGTAVSDGFFETFGVQPRLGRWFVPEEQKPGAACVLMASYGFWMRKLGGRPDAAGATITLGDQPCRVTGVMPESFRFMDGHVIEYWTPIRYRATGRTQHQYSAYARLKPGIGLSPAQAQMAEIGRRLETAFPENAGWGVHVSSLRSELLRDYGPALGLFAGAALIVLLAGSAGVASLLLARGVARRKEIAVRVALGAGRRRVVRLLLTESLLLSGLGALAGLLFAAWLISLAVAAAPPWMELGALVSISPTLVAFTVAIALLTGLLTGLWPALRGSRVNLQDELKESAGLAGGRSQQRALRGLVLVEIGLAVVLLAFAGLLARSFATLAATNLGFRPDHLLTFRMAPPASRYGDDAARLRFWNTLLSRLGALPGVTSAAATDSIPLGGTYSGAGMLVEGEAAPRDWTDLTARYASITPEYLHTMGIPLIAGRNFTPLDTAQAEPVLLVNQTFVRRIMRGANPIGRRVRDRGGKWRRIVGVVGDSHYGGAAQPVESEFYAASTQDTFLQFVVLRTAVPEDSILRAARHAVRELDPAIPITQVRTMRQSLEMDTGLNRKLAALMAGFAAITLAMATLGLAGVMAYSVSRRKREIGLRIALGARRADVARAILRTAAVLIAAGSAIGLLTAALAARLLASFLYGVEPHDPMVLAAAPLLLAAVALAACLLPAHRAARIEPMEALRQE